MNKQRPILRFIVIGLCALLLIAAAALFGLLIWARGSVPDYNRGSVVAGLDQSVEIVRDERAIPHIFAHTLTDGYVGLGFVHGQDRLWQLEMTRRVGRGRLAEAVGADGLALDMLIAGLDVEALAERTERGYTKATRDAIHAYVVGINAAIASLKGPPPPEFLLLDAKPEPWTDRDVSRLAGLLTLGFGDWRDELLRARLAPLLSCDALRSLFASPADAGPVTYPDFIAPPAAPPINSCGALQLRAPQHAFDERLPFGRALPASNTWAVVGARSKSGMPMLANDPHGPLTAPADYYLVRISGPGFELAGASRPGSPGFASARTGDIAWGITDMMADQTDLFVEKIDPAAPSRYLTPEGSEPFVERVVSIPVRGEEARQVRLRYTRHGLVLSDIDEEAKRFVNEQLPPGHVVALAGVDFPEGQPIIEAFIDMARARDFREFRSSIAKFHFQHNFAYADRVGHIAMASAARVPKRGGDGFLPVPGWTGAFDWMGLAYPEHMPAQADPPRGYVANANNRAAPSPNALLESASFEPPWRALRIEETLEAAHGADLAAMRALQLDVTSTQVGALAPLLQPIELDSETARAARDMLLAWDGVMAKDRPEPLIWSAWMRALGFALFEPKLGALAQDYLSTHRPRFDLLLAGVGGWCELREGEASCSAIAARAFGTAIAELQKLQGATPENWRWGAVHKAAFNNDIFSRIPIVRGLIAPSPETDGDATTVNAGQSDLWSDAPYRDVYGPRYRQIVDLSDPSKSLYMVAPGVSGNPLSPWFSHLVIPWSEGRYFTLSGAAEEVVSHSVGRLELVPPERDDGA